MRYASVCSGVEAASLAWIPLGWEAVWFSEIEPFPSAVLKERFPDVPNLGDMTKIDGRLYRGAVDLLVGGTPCQGFSVAGKREGLQDPRSNLCLAYCRLLETMRPRWFVWENVPGVLSTNGGNDFKQFIRTIDEIGYCCAWRILDAQYVRVDGFPRAVPQRRRRLFVVGHTGGWEYPAEVLFEPHCLQGNTPPRRKTWKSVAENAKNCTGTTSAEGGIEYIAVDGYNACVVGDRVNSLTRNAGYVDAKAAVMEVAYLIGNGQVNQPASEIAQTIDTMHDVQAVACFEWYARDLRVKETEYSPTIKQSAGTGGGNLPLVEEFIQRYESGEIKIVSARVRRLLPIECERLMGFPEDYTKIPYRGKPQENCPDSPRYRACGNSMCVNVMRWIGMRIEMVERKRKNDR